MAHMDTVLVWRGDTDIPENNSFIRGNCGGIGYTLLYMYLS